MVQLTVDTNTDPIPELEEALHILQTAILRRSAAQLPSQAPSSSKSAPAPLPEQEESSLDTPFLKITVKDVPDVPESDSVNAPGAKIPTLNQLLSDDSLSEDEITTLFKETQRLEAESRPAKSASESNAKKESSRESSEAFIEIVEFDEEK